MRCIVLSEWEASHIRQIYSESQSQTIRRRCLFLLLSASGLSMTETAKRSGACRHTVYRFFNRWQATSGYRLGLLNISPGRGRKLKLREFPMVSIIRKLLKAHGYKPDVLCTFLSEGYGISVCRKTLRSFIVYHNL